MQPCLKMLFTRWISNKHILSNLLSRPITHLHNNIWSLKILKQMHFPNTVWGGERHYDDNQMIIWLVYFRYHKDYYCVWKNITMVKKKSNLTTKYSTDGDLPVQALTLTLVPERAKLMTHECRDKVGPKDGTFSSCPCFLFILRIFFILLFPDVIVCPIHPIVILLFLAFSSLCI